MKKITIKSYSLFFIGTEAILPKRLIKDPSLALRINSTMQFFFAL
ncbi:MAG: hypothetical protein WC412_07825 [Candidatus Omnitrophota bacterium]